MPTLRRKFGRFSRTPAFGYLIVVLFFFGGSVANTVRLDARQQHLRIVGCERGKLDRRDNAEAWTAHTVYIEHVILAASVQEDVKRAARVEVAHDKRIAASLTRRARVDCATGKLPPR